MNHLTQSLRRLVAAALVLLTMPAFAQLSGTYTIDPAGTGTTNYASFTAAVSALTTSGVSGPVTFNVAAGTYNEQIVIGAITGSSATNRVTFQKAPTATGAAVLTFAATSTANFTIRLAAASNITFKDLTLANTANTGQTVGGIVEYGGTVTNIQFINNIFNGNAGTSTSSSYGALRYGSTPSTGYATGVWKVIGNTFNNVSYGANIYGSSTINADSAIITDNTINGTYYHIYTYYSKNVVVNNNTINTAAGFVGYNYVYYPATSVVMNNNTMNGMAYGMYSVTTTTNTGTLTYSINNNVVNSASSASTAYGFYISGSSTAANKIAKVTIKNNKLNLIGSSTVYGIYASYVGATTADPSDISNNMISCVSGSTASVYGFYPYHLANMNFDHNTVHVTGGSATAGRAVYINRSTSTTAIAVGGLNMRNNIISNTGLGYAIEIASTANTAAMIGAVSNNAYQGNTVNPFRNGTTNYTTLADWQTATTKDAGSAFGTILFYNSADLHVQNALANNIGTPLAGITTDIDGQTRSTTTPDAGADEYTPLSCFAVGGITAGTISNTSFVATWTTPNTSNFAKQGRIRAVGATSWAIVNALGATPTLTFNGLTASTTYEYQIRTICAAGDTSIWSTTNLVQTSSCPINLQCAFTLEMTDSYGDGWNGALVAIQQKAGNGSWTTVATAGATFTTGTTHPPITVNLCNGDSTRIIAVSPGSFSYEVGFVFKNANGVTLIQRLPGTSSTGTFVTGFVFGSFATTCPSPCPITAVPTLTGLPSCGGLPTTITATGNTTSQVVYWSTAGRPNGIGATYTTGTIPVTGDTVSARLYVRNQFNTPVVGGPLISAFAAAGTTVGYSTSPTGNFSNGFGIDASQPMTLDSATVRAFATTAGGTVKFVVQVFERKGNITAGTTTPVGKLIARTDTITVTTTSTTGENFRIPLGLNLIPGRYHIKLAYASSTTGRLYRSSALPSGVSYPMAIGTLGSVDSVALGTPTAYSPTRVYYLFDLKATEGCMGPETKFFVPYFSTSVSMPYTEQFGSGIPCNWTTASQSGAAWVSTATYSGNGYTATSLNGSSFAIVNDDAAGSSALTSNSSLTTPELPALGYDTLTMKFLSVFKGGSWGGKGYLEVWRPVNGVFGWQVIDSLSADEGLGAIATGWAPAQKTYDVTAYQSNQFKARFRYDDKGLWAGWWAIDNFQLYGTQSPSGNVRVAITTDIYGSEVSWKIVNTANKLVYASGGPFADVTPYNAALATHIDTVQIPVNGTYEFRITDSYGDGLTDGTNTGTYLAEVLCAWGNDLILSGSGALPNDPGGSTANVASWDSATFNLNCIQYKNVTFQVDMNQVSQSFTTPEVNGFWNSWCGNCNAMADANGDGIWTVTLPLPVGSTQEFKYSADNWTIQEMNNPAAPCTNGNATYTNRVLVVPAQDTTLPVVCWSQCTACDVDVTLKVNMAWEKANNAISANGVHVAGDFQGWNPSATPMTDADNDGIYEVTINVPANSSIQYKFINGNAWGSDESVPAACVVSGTWNRGATFTYADSTLSPVCFGKCTDCMASIDEALQNVSLFPNPTRGQFQLARMDASANVEVSVLDLQGKVLTVAKWNEGAESLSIDLGNFANGVYMVRLTSEEGSRTLRVSVQK